MSIRNQEQFVALTDAFNVAAVTGQGWGQALAGLAVATNATCGQLIGVGDAATIPFNWLSDFPDEAMPEFAAMEGGSPLVNTRIAASVSARVLVTVTEQDYASVEPTLRTRAYLDWADRYGITFGCQSNLVSGEGGLVGLAVLRPRRFGPTTREEQDAFSLIAPHVRSAVRTQMLLEQKAAPVLAGALETASLAAFLCDGDGCVQALTARAEALLQTSPLLTLRHKRLSATAARFSVPLDVAIERALVGASTAGPASSTVVLSAMMFDHPPLLLDVLSLPLRPWSFGFAPRVLVVARTGPDRDDGDKVLQAAYTLTAAEAAVALALVSGKSRAAIAHARGAAIETVRAQIKALFQKVGVRRERELVARLAALIRR